MGKKKKRNNNKENKISKRPNSSKVFGFGAHSVSLVSVFFSLSFSFQFRFHLTVILLLELPFFNPIVEYEIKKVIAKWKSHIIIAEPESMLLVLVVLLLLQRYAYRTRRKYSEKKHIHAIPN